MTKKRRPSYMSVDSVVFRFVRISKRDGYYEKFAEVSPWRHPGNTTAGCAAKLADFLNAFEAMSGVEAQAAILKGRNFQGWER